MQRMAAGDAADVSALHMSAHFATHMDAPAHYLPGGAAIDKAPLELLVGEAYLLDARTAGTRIDAAAVERVPKGVLRVLVRSVYEQHDKSAGFFPQFAGLTNAATALLKTRGVRLLGADAPSFAVMEETEAAHRTFLCDDDHWIVEHLDLRGVGEGWYDIICLPLKAAGSEGAPARVLLREKEERYEV